MDTAYQILELGDDLNRLVSLKRKSRESYIENCKSIFDSYCLFYQQSETDFILALQLINNSLDELDFGSNKFIINVFVNATRQKRKKQLLRIRNMDFPWIQKMDYLDNDEPKILNKFWGCSLNASLKKYIDMNI